MEKFPSIESIISGVDLKSYGTVSIAWTESLMRLEMGTSWILGFLKSYISFLKLSRKLHLKIGFLPQKEMNHLPTINFQGLLLLVLGSVCD